MPRKWKDSEVLKIKHRKLMLSFSILPVALALFDIIYGKFTLYDVCTIPMGVFGIYCYGFNGIYKISKLTAAWNMKRKDNKFDYYHT